MIALAEQTKEIAESVRSDADAGKFDGEPGKPGDPGKDGVSPSAKVEQTDEGAMVTVTDATGTTTAELKNGKDGNPGQNATDEQVRTAVDAYMEEHPIQADSDDIIKLAIKNEASGAVPIVVTDSADMGVQDLEMRGKTEQNSTEGNQLLDKSGIVLSGTTITYTPVNVGDGEFTLSTDYKATGRNDIFFLPGNVNTGASSLSNGVEHGTSRTVTSENGYVTVALRLGSDGTASPLNYQIMLNSGSTALTYEPYTGGAPSPSPEYPQEITSAGNYNAETQKYEYEVKLTGKNLFDAEYFRTTVNWKPPADGNGYPYIPIYIGNGNTVTISTDGTPTEGLGFYCAIARTNKNTSSKVYTWIYHSTNAGLINTNVSFTVVEDDYIYFALSRGADNIEKFLNAFINFQIEISAQKTEYQPYKEQTVILTSDRLLTKWDKLEKRDGVWGWVYKSNIVDDISTLIPDDTVIYGQSGKRYFSISKRSLGDVMFNYGATKAMSEAGVNPTSKAVRYQLGISLDSFVIAVSDDDIIETAKEHMHYKTLYEVISETFVPLSETEQEALNTLHTYYPTTTVSNDAGCDMSLTYIADTKAYIDSKIAAIQAAVVNRI